MTQIIINTEIKAPIENVFDNARNIDLHLKTMTHTNEIAIDGKKSGLIDLGESVTWSARHFGCKLLHKSLITEMNSPIYFVDQMVEGHFKYFNHIHQFKEVTSNTVIMTDIINYELLKGIFGKIFDKLYIKNYLTRILTDRAIKLKQISEHNEKSFPNS